MTSQPTTMCVQIATTWTSSGPHDSKICYTAYRDIGSFPVARVLGLATPFGRARRRRHRDRPRQRHRHRWNFRYARPHVCCTADPMGSIGGVISLVFDFWQHLPTPPGEGEATALVGRWARNKRPPPVTERDRGRALCRYSRGLAIARHRKLPQAPNAKPPLPLVSLRLT